MRSSKLPHLLKGGENRQFPVFPVLVLLRFSIKIDNFGFHFHEISLSAIVKAS